MGKNIVLIIVCAVGLVASGVLLWDAFWWPISDAHLTLLIQQVGILLLLLGVVFVLMKNWSWLLFCFLLGAALMAQINVVSWIYEHRAEITRPAATSTVTPDATTKTPGQPDPAQQKPAK